VMGSEVGGEVRGNCSGSLMMWGFVAWVCLGERWCRRDFDRWPAGLPRRQGAARNDEVGWGGSVRF